jgi:DNA-binding transcriptional ArsR family regulator
VTASPPDDRLDPLFAALADPTRRQVLELLAGGIETATALSARLPVSRQAVSKHLDALEAAGLVRASRVGRERRFSLETSALDPLERWMQHLEAEWDRRLAALQALIEQEAGSTKQEV